MIECSKRILVVSDLLLRSCKRVLFVRNYNRRSSWGCSRCRRCSCRSCRCCSGSRSWRRCRRRSGSSSNREGARGNRYCIIAIGCIVRGKNICIGTRSLITIRPSERNVTKFIVVNLTFSYLASEGRISSASNLGCVVNRDGDWSRSDLIGASYRTSIIALTSNGNRDRACINGLSIVNRVV